MKYENRQVVGHYTCQGYQTGNFLLKKHILALSKNGFWHFNQLREIISPDNYLVLFTFSNMSIIDFTAPSQMMAALREIARSLSSAVDLDTTLDLIVRKTTEVMQVDSCTIYLLDPGRDILRLQASTGLAHRALGRATLRVGEGMTGHAVLRSEPVYATKAQHDPHYKPVEEAEETGFQSLLAVPMLIETRPMGAINVQTKHPHEFTLAEVELLRLIADLAAGALSKAELYDHQKRQLEELQLLARLSEAVNTPQYLDDMLNVVTKMAAQTLNAAVCSLFLLNEAGTHLELRSARQEQTHYSPRPPLPLGEGVIGQVATQGAPIYIAQVQDDPRYLGKERAKAEGLVSMLAVPLQVRGRVMGVLTCYTHQRREFTEEQQTLLLTLANQTALAIENAQLVTNAAVIREMHHRIKNNLQTVAMLMRLQMSDAHKLTTAEVLELNISRIQSIAAVHEVLSHKGFRLVDVRDVITRIAHMTQKSMTHPNQEITIDVFGQTIDLPSQAATALALVVNELILNALEHGLAQQPTGRVEISLGRSQTELIVLVRDNGRGLPAGETFQKGLGLEIAETLVKEDLQGQLKFNRLSHGTEVSIRVPRTIEHPIS